jgi:hypothetical protein
METSNRGYLKWLAYSGISVIITLNPYHWRWVPWARRDYNDGWPSPNERCWSVGWTFLIVRIWIDNGDW